ncbi:MAG: T9SS type A sorting domain-containing protein [Balneolales bacterium]|nr:T9SS type A sorting domain-containing protein [Balneolales bacterium]
MDNIYARKGHGGFVPAWYLFKNKRPGRCSLSLLSIPIIAVLLALMFQLPVTTYAQDASSYAADRDEAAVLLNARIDAGSAENWAILNSSPGVNGEIHALLRQGDFLYAGGSFTVPDTEVSGLGRLNVQTGEWEALGFDCDEDCQVNALAVLGSFLYAGGSCVWSNDETSCGAIQRYNLNTGVWGGIDTNLTRDGSGNAVVTALAVSDGQVIVGGHFDRAGETELQNIARFRTSNRSWNRLGAGISEPVRALLTNDEKVYVGIELSENALAGTTQIKGLAVYDYSGNRTNNAGWANIGEITKPFRPGNAVVNALVLSGGHVYAGGFFDNVRNGSSNLLAYSLTSFNLSNESWRVYPDGRFDDITAMAMGPNGLVVITPDIIDTPGTTPSALSLNIGEEELQWNGFGVQAFNSPARAVAADDDNIYFGGDFTRAGSQTNTGGLAGYTPETNSWFIFGAPWGETDAIVSGGEILAFANSGRDIIAGGAFTSAGGDEAITRIGAFSTETRGWTALGGGFGDGIVRAIAASEELIFTGGDFSIFADGSPAPALAQFDRSSQSWTVLGDALTGADEAPVLIHALFWDGDRLFVAGSFSEADGQPAANLAIYSPEEGWSSPDAPFDGPVHALAVWGNTLFAGGAFTEPATALAMLDLETGEWSGIDGLSPASDDLPAVVYALQNKIGKTLYVGGNFSAESGGEHFAVLSIADLTWTSVSGSPEGPVFDLKVYGDNIFLAGDFSGAGSAEGSANIVRRNWADSEWLSISSGTDAPVQAIAPYADELFLGGGFSSPATGFTSWTGVSGFFAGAGTETHPFEVTNLFEFDRVRWFFESHFSQAQDLNFSASVRIDPIGNPQYPFMGNWQGNDFAVSGYSFICISTLSCGTRPRSNNGLFGYTEGAVIENTHLVNARVLSALEGVNVGGLVAHAHDTIIRNSSVTAEVRGVTNVGTFAGQTSGSTVIENSFAAHRTGAGLSSSAGVPGVSGSLNVGGFVGLHAGALIQNAYAHGSLRALGSDAENLGGFAGSAELDSEIRMAYSAVHFPDDFSTLSAAGGFIGSSQGSIVADVFWDDELSTADFDLFATALTSAQMQLGASFEPFDFENTWEIIEGRTFPWLKAENAGGAVGSGTFGTVIAAGPHIEGAEGWRYFGMSFTGNQSYAEFTRFLATQGFVGADVPPGISNLYYYASSNRWRSVTGISPSGAGSPETSAFAIYAFAPPLQTEVDVHAIVSQYRKPALEITEPVKGFTVNQLPDEGAPSGGVWTLMANNNLWPMDTDALDRSGLSEAVYVYDSAIPGYRSWNGLAGELEDGIIQPFTAFFVETLEDDASLGVPAAALVTNPDAERPGTDAPALRLLAETEGLHPATSWLSYSGSTQPRNARQLQPMDVRSYLELSLEKEGRLYDILDLAAGQQEEIRIPLSIIRYEADGEGWQATAATAELNWSETDRFPDDWGLALLDTQTGEITDLRTASSVTVETAVPQQGRPAPRGELTAQMSAPAERDAPMAARYQLLVRPGSESGPGEETQLPEAVSLSQNYPNPFNPITQIQYSLPSAADVRLEVYNVLGQRVASLVNGTVEAGVHTVSFDAANLSSGVYLYRLQTSGMVITRKMLLVK